MFEKLQKSLKSQGFRESAVKAVGKVGNLAVVEALIAALSDEQVYGVGDIAAEALGKIGSITYTSRHCLCTSLENLTIQLGERSLL